MIPTAYQTRAVEIVDDLNSVTKLLSEKNKSI